MLAKGNVNLEWNQPGVIMTLEEFLKSTKQENVPPNLSPALQSLWHAYRGDWERAHTLAQAIHTEEGSWIHANLHREDGQRENADYWYARCGCGRPELSVEGEREKILRALLEPS